MFNLLECATVLMHAADVASGHSMFPSSLLWKWSRQSNLYAIGGTNCLPVEIGEWKRQTEISFRFIILICECK